MFYMDLKIIYYYDSKLGNVFHSAKYIVGLPLVPICTEYVEG